MKKLALILFFISTLFCQSKETDTTGYNERLKFFRYHLSIGFQFYNVDKINMELEDANFPYLENKCITHGLSFGLRFKDTSSREGMSKWFNNHAYSIISIKTSSLSDESRRSPINYANFNYTTIGFDFLINFSITDYLSFYLFPGISYTWSEVTIGRSSADYFNLKEYLNSPSEIYEINKNYFSFIVGAGFDFKMDLSKLDLLIGIVIKMNIFEFPLYGENPSENKIGVRLHNLTPDFTNAFSIELKIGIEEKI